MHERERGYCIQVWESLWKVYDRCFTDGLAGYIIGREISPQEVDTTDTRHSSLNSYSGTYLNINGAKATEVFVTQMLDLTINYEELNYSVTRPVSISSWPTLDPLNHPTEIYTDEDKAAYDLAKIITEKSGTGYLCILSCLPVLSEFYQ